MGTSARVLLVDDDPDIRLLGGLALRSGGWTVETAGSVSEARDQVLAQRPDVVLLDVVMDEAPGTALLPHIPPGVPFVFLTAQDEPGQAEALRALGAAGVLHKPFDPLHLSGHLRSIVDG